MNQTISCLSESEQEPQCTDLQIIFRQMHALFAAQKLFSQTKKVSLLVETKDRLISLKMRSKLLEWLERLALTTFKFHRSTFINAIFILDQYLQCTNQSPSQLQMIGCACLLLASKMKQEIIVAPECYVSASCNIYSKKQLLQKQVIVCSKVSFKKIKEGVLKGVYKGCLALKMKKNIQSALEVLTQIMKRQQFCQWSEGKVLCAIFSLLKLNQERKINSKDIQTMESLL